MVKKVEVFETYDGRTFDTAAEAGIHEFTQRMTDILKDIKPKSAVQRVIGALVDNHGPVHAAIDEYHKSVGGSE